METRLDLMTYQELKDHFYWVVEEVKRHEEIYNNQTDSLLRLLSDLSQELVKRRNISVVEDSGPTNGG
jgi:hypothetical protein